ncbi:site-specific integrase [Streptomyces sp. WM6368]|uniref:site-specific integrase n=1 Tax=Streptomyces sp. WM6368 TaxID=1415554 RepID=UPI0006B029B6
MSDELIRRNPCQVKGAGSVHTPERPTVTVKEVYALAETVQPRYRALVLMAGFLGLRWGELIGLHRRDVDLEHRTVRVRRAVAALSNGQREIKAPKSAAGKRTVSIPGVILPDLQEHLKRFVEAGAMGVSSSGPRGRPRAATPSTCSGTRRAVRPGSRGCTFMTFGTRGTRSPRQQVPAQGS